MRALFLSAAAALALAACSQPATTTTAETTEAAVTAPVRVEAPAGTYTSDPNHTSVTFRANHLGLSNYTARFVESDITLDIDPANPSEARVAATIDPTSIRTDFPGDYRGTHAGTPFNSFDEALAQDANWLDAGDHPEITFQSTSVTPTGPTTATVEGNLTLKGVTRPVTLEATYNGSMAQHPGAGAGAIGFSARGTIKRSEFGITFGIPPEGSTMGVSDDIEVVIESELLQQPG